MRRGVRLVTDGTDNHLVLLDVSGYGLTGRQAESALLDAGIVTNRNSIPRDPNGAWYTSGVRIGTPALTSRGFGAAEFDEVASLIVDVLSATTPDGGQQRPVQGEVRAGRRRGRQGPRGLGRPARAAPALPRPRPQLAAAQSRGGMFVTAPSNTTTSRVRPDDRAGAGGARPGRPAVKMATGQSPGDRRTGRTCGEQQGPVRVGQADRQARSGRPG